MKPPTQLRPKTFDLGGLVRDILEEASLSDPTDIAHELERRIPPQHRLDALRIALRHYVRVTITQARVGRALIDAPPVGTPSSKVAAIREAWRKTLRQRVYVGDETWKTLSDCTRDDLLAMVSARTEQANQLLAKANEYSRLVDAMDANGVERVGDLPDVVLASALADAA